MGKLLIIKYNLAKMWICRDHQENKGTHNQKTKKTQDQDREREEPKVNPIKKLKKEIEIENKN